MSSKSIYLLGAMSGTSTDGVDVVVLETDSDFTILKFIDLHSIDFPEGLRDRLLSLQNPAFSYDHLDPFHELMLARRDLTGLYADAANTLLKKLSISKQQVLAYGVHGQTIRHKPDQGYTFQIIDSTLIAELTKIRVVSDLRSADVAAGGQGAPLVCAFHEAWLRTGSSDKSVSTTAVLNLGGFSNLTIIGENSHVVAGGDCGPANLYLDWCAKKYFDVDFDSQGERARSGRVHPLLLEQLMQHPYFAKQWPASTGREDFDLYWLQTCLSGFTDLLAADVLRTLLEFSVLAVSRCLNQFGSGDLYYCGGGANNHFMIERLNQILAPKWLLHDFHVLGLPSQAVEAAAFAWLAGCYHFNLTGNCTKVTGASRPVVLGQATPPVQP